VAGIRGEVFLRVRGTSCFSSRGTRKAGAPFPDEIRSLGYPAGKSERGKPAGRAQAWLAGASSFESPLRYHHNTQREFGLALDSLFAI
jgi:hypothetical protein